MKHLVIGLGEVGSAIRNILDCDGYDPYKEGGTLNGPYDMVHICFPWQAEFVKEVRRYTGSGKAKHVVIHSSVPIGTCDAEGWTHSPVRGVHPNLEEGIRTFVKYFGGQGAELAAHVFDDLGIKTKTFETARTTEAAKLLDTTQYGLMIMIEKRIHEWCERNNVRFDLVYNEFNRTYNTGYIQLGMPHVVRSTRS